jgi:hypothetical protein
VLSDDRDSLPIGGGYESLCGTAETQPTSAHAVKISTGGKPIFMITEKQTFTL